IDASPIAPSSFSGHRLIVAHSSISLEISVGNRRSGGHSRQIDSIEALATRVVSIACCRSAGHGRPFNSIWLAAFAYDAAFVRKQPHLTRAKNGAHGPVLASCVLKNRSFQSPPPTDGIGM